jgi:hypothetical protein
MGKVFMLLFITLLLLVSGCTTETGKVVETTKLTIPESSQQTSSQETIEELHKEFEEFEKSQNENLSSAEQNETQKEVITESTEETENITSESMTISEEISEQETSTQNESIEKHCPSCEDNDSCTTDSCSEETDYECMHEQIIPCCGNGNCEETENWSACHEDCECDLDCGVCETPDNESCSCLPKTECIQDGCCPGNCTYLEDSDCPKPSVVFSEIFYNANGTDTKHEWIEIYNNGTVAIDITKWRFEENGTQHLLKNTTNEILLKTKSYAVIVQDEIQFLQDYPDYTGLLFDSSFSLSNTGEELILRAGKDGEILDSVFYNSTWGGDGTGFSLEKIDLNGPNTQENWNQSLVLRGTPGQKNSISP